MGSRELLLQEVTKRLIEAAQPEKIILFGSYSRGTPTADSDLDLLVIEKKTTNILQEIIRLRRSLRGLKVPIDILVATPKDFEERASVPGTVYYWAKKEGKILYEAA